MRLVGLVVAIPLLAACAHTSADQGTASCVGPYLDDQPPTGSYGAPAPTVGPGDDLMIYGHWYTSTCNDTSGDHDPLVALPPVRLTLRLPGGVEIALGAFTPGGHGMGFTVPVQVPKTASGGTALVTDDLHHSYSFLVAPN